MSYQSDGIIPGTEKVWKEVWGPFVTRKLTGIKTTKGVTAY